MDDVRAFIDDYFKAWQATDGDRILSYYTETVSLEVPGMVLSSRAAVRDQFVRPFVAGLPGNRHIVKNIMFGKDESGVHNSRGTIARPRDRGQYRDLPLHRRAVDVVATRDASRLSCDKGPH
jgi:uncharacterized protein (TIGR02246 family)